MKKSILSLLLLFSILASFAACSGTSETTPSGTSSAPTESKAGIKYKDNVDFDAFFADAEKAIDLGNDTNGNAVKAIQANKISVKLMTGIKGIIEDGTADRYTLCTTGGTTLDEYGILHFADAASAQKVVDAAKAYIKSKADDKTTLSYYSDEEQSKVLNGEVKAFGNYVAYAMLSGKYRASFFAKIEELLKA